MLSNSFFFSQTTPSKLESSIALLKYRFDCFSEIYLIRLSRRVLESIFLKMYPTDLCSKNLGTNALKMFHHTAKLLINCLFSIWWSKFIFVMGFFNHFFFFETNVAQDTYLHHLCFVKTRMKKLRYQRSRHINLKVKKLLLVMKMSDIFELLLKARFTYLITGSLVSSIRKQLRQSD